jgi:hypothetical protein
MKKILFLATILLIGFIYSCKDDDTTEPAKTLDKSQITNKNWVTTDNTISFYLRSDNKATGAGGKNEMGTWKWVNNSDTLLIDYDIFADEKWIVKYCTATELSAKLEGSSVYDIFTVQ